MMDALREKVLAVILEEMGELGDRFCGHENAADVILAIPEIASALALQASIVKTTVSKEPQA